MKKIVTYLEYEGLVAYIFNKRFKPFVRLELFEWEDFYQEKRLIALEIERKYKKNDREDKKMQKEIHSYIYKSWYAFLKKMGYRRPKYKKGYIKNSYILTNKANELLEKLKEI